MNFGFQTRTAILALTAVIGLVADEKPSIVSAVPNYNTTPHQLTITGTGFGNSTPLVVISLLPALVLSHTNTIVTVQIPLLLDLFPGTHLLTLATGFGNGNQAQMVVTLGNSSGGGTAGPAGPTGPQGPAGPAGAKGATGSPGPAGATGVAGAKGATGSQGVAGATGPQGAVGATGVQGVPGATGPQGAVGATGAQGPAGPQGLTGAQGPAGINGVNGAPGATGAAGPAGPAGPSGGALKVSTVTLHRADVLTLNSAAVTLIPATAGVVKLPMRIVVQQNNAYYASGSGSLFFAYGTIATPLTANSSGILWGSGIAKYLVDTSFSTLTNDDASSFAGQPYIAYLPTTDTIDEQGGTGGDVTFTVWYTEVTIQ